MTWKTVPWILVPVLFVTSLVFAVRWDPPQSKVHAGLRVDFGYGRAAVSRARIISLCALDPTRFMECKPEFKPGATRPAITGVTWSRDFTPADPKQPNCTDTFGTVFPASQVDVTAANFEPNGLNVSVTAVPDTPFRVSAGTYCSSMLITREGEPNPIVYPVVIDLRDRYAAAIVYRVLLTLLYGALFGALLKWIANNLGEKDAPAKMVSAPDAGTFRNWLAKHSGLALGVTTAVGVAILGSQSQFVAAASFGNNFLDYLTLFIWAFAGQLAGQTVLDVAAKSGAATAAARASNEQESSREKKGGPAGEEAAPVEAAGEEAAPVEAAGEEAAPVEAAGDDAAPVQPAGDDAPVPEGPIVGVSPGHRRG